jgi:glycosyltransferase involved in cell wall biosynthesis
LELLGAAQCFAYLSFYEGFGLPVLESISCGVPTVTSNISSLPEVVSSSALLVNPNDVNEIYCAITSIISNKEVALTLSKLAIKRSQLFSWSKTSTMTIDAYNKVLKIYYNKRDVN